MRIRAPFHYYVHFVRLDHYFSEKNRMFVRLDYDHYFETDPGFYNNVSGGINLTRINRGAAVDDVLVLSSHTTLGRPGRQRSRLETGAAS